MSTFTGKVIDVNLLREIAEALRVKHGLRYFIDVNDGESCKAKTLALKKAQQLSPQTLGRLIAADPLTEDHSPEWVWVSDWLRQATNPIQVLQRQAALAIFGRISELCSEHPIFDHNCTRCTYLGAMQRQTVRSEITTPPVFPRVVDLHACKGHHGFLWVARYGNQPGEYIDSEGCGLSNPSESHLAEALRRAYSRGLFAGL